MEAVRPSELSKWYHPLAERFNCGNQVHENAKGGPPARYPGKDQNKNSGIYLGRGANGSIWILDQWPARVGTGQKAHPPQPRELHPGGSNVSNNSSAYYVILVAPR
ncbi:MAG: BPSL0067 family protein [Candidatus Acidiferrales bacterium]